MKQSIAIVLASAVGVFAQGKPILDYPDGLSGPFDPGFWSGTTAPQFTVQQWTNGKAPASCVSELSGNGCPSGHALVYNITYADCARPWTFCRCDSAQLTLSAMADLFGRMPVHLRSTVRHPMAVNKPEGGCSAYATINGGQGDIVMQGACNAPTVWIHESAHQLDFRGDLANVPYHNTADYTLSMLNDTCAADDYGNKSLTEAFAQIAVIAQYSVIFGTIPPQVSPGCLDHSVNSIKNKFGVSHLTYGGTCSNRLADSPAVAATWSKRSVKSRSHDHEHPCNFGKLWTPPSK